MRSPTVARVRLRIGLVTARHRPEGPHMFSKQFLADLAERATKTFAQSALATLGAGSINLLSVDWVGVLSIGGGAAVVSVLTSLASERFGNSGTASLTDAVEPAAAE